jgi:aminopeptidase N
MKSKGTSKAGIFGAMRKLSSIVLFALLVAACGKKAHRAAKASSDDKTLVRELQMEEGLWGEVDSADSDGEELRSDRAKSYYGSKPLHWRLWHTELDIALDWEREEVYGEARLWIVPHAVPRESLSIDAKAFTFEEIRVERPAGVQIVSQRYDTFQLHLRLSRPLRTADTLVLRLRYRAHPHWLDTLLTNESEDIAISGRKGAYFINARGERPCIPRQFWTQGEPESASAWFPTLDSPNQKTTQRLCVTIADSFKTLSNGLLVTSEKLAGGLRRDCWELRQPHAPYLFALIVGPFEIIKDKWRDKELLYYMEREWVSHTKTIFGNTPRMIEYFSQLLGVPFPWPKYGQVIVREFVSGAMENTTAVVHGEMLFYDKSIALTNDDKETVIAHELFHHWFGDLVTCESWAQLPLNESFADYSEYLWLAYDKGFEAAEDHRRTAQLTYLAEAAQKQVPLIRFEEKDPMGMFDAHSYQKGSLILHLLRHYVGDTLFFSALKTYLTQNAYKAADIDHLRHAFEEVTGEDWTWFFDQHFRRGDEVRLKVTGEMRGDTGVLRIIQRGYRKELGPHRYLLPLEVTSRNGIERIPFELVGDTEVVVVRPGLLYVDYDPERLFVGLVERVYPGSWWKEMLLRSPYLARVEALRRLTSSLDDSSMQLLLRTYEGASPYWKKRLWEGWAYLWDVETIQKVLPLAQKEIESPEVKVRAAAWEWLASMLNQFEEMGSLLMGDSSQAVPAALQPTYWTEAAQKALQDSSATVIQAALQVLGMGDKARAQEAALSLLTHPSEEIFLAASMVLIREKSPIGLQALLARQPCLASLEARASAISLLAMSTRSFPSEREKIVASLQQIARYENPWYLRLIAVRGLRRLAATDQTIRSFLRELKKSERHPILKKVYEREL